MGARSNCLTRRATPQDVISSEELPLGRYFTPSPNEIIEANADVLESARKTRERCRIRRSRILLPKIV